MKTFNFEVRLERSYSLLLVYKPRVRRQLVMKIWWLIDLYL